ncbi:MAG: S8 family serine peptidase [Sedimentisphaerales bacterium]|nr:S8 family serine peptidase [Sedimentisphaerales bacterium]
MGHCPIKTGLSHLIAVVVILFILSGLAFADSTSSPQAAQPDNQSFQPQGLNHAGIYKLRQTDPDLTGAGVKIAIVSRSITYIDGKPQNDYRPAVDHNCFKSASFVFHDSPDAPQPAGISSHSTAVCSILLGRDPNAYNEQVGRFLYEGVAPDAEADVYEFWNFLIDSVFPFSAPDADVITADIGYQFEDWWTRGIEAMARQYGLTVVVGIGNGYNSFDPALYPGAGSNVIGVGVIQSVNTGDAAEGLSRFALVYPEYSSQGPTADGRSKPDIVAPGNCLAAATGQVDIYEPTGDWSSFATPIVAGTAGLLIQKANSQSNLQSAVSGDGGNCVIKSILLNSATKLPYWHKGRLSKDDDHDAPLDWIQGAGMVNAIEAYNQLLAGRQSPGNCQPGGWDINKLSADETPANVYKMTIAEPADTVISATVNWNRRFETVYPFEHQTEKDCDIRLELWAIDSGDANNSYLLDYSDSRTDNVEHIYSPADANITEYEIVVAYSEDHDVNQPADSGPYGLCWSISQKPERDETLWLDLNADGFVSHLDVSVLLGNILTSIETPGRYVLGDINSDGQLDADDLNIFLKHISPSLPPLANR